MELGASTAEVFVPCGPPDRHGRRDRRPRRTPVGRAGAGGLRWRLRRRLDPIQQNSAESRRLVRSDCRPGSDHSVSLTCDFFSERALICAIVFQHLSTVPGIFGSPAEQSRNRFPSLIGRSVLCL
jgi:hypothetical protein